MSYPITVQYIQGIPQLPYEHGVGAYEGVVCHSTAVYGDSDEGERNYEQGHWGDAFVHFFVDEDSIIQCAPTSYLSWGAGHTANSKFINIELCQSTDSSKFQQAYARYVWLVAKVLHDKGLGVSDKGTLWSHADISATFKETNHTDPIAYLASHGVSWAQHVQNVVNAYNELNAPAQPAHPYPGHFIQINSNDHASVQLIQQALHIPADGIFGNQTLSAIKHFQTFKGLGADGIVGPATWKAIFG